MADSSTMDNDALEHPSYAVSFPLQALPPEIRQLVWIMAAEQAADAFRHKYPDFNRFWFTRNKPPYISFAAHTMDARGDPHRSILRDLEVFFWPLFLTNKESLAIVNRYISKFHERKKAPQLLLNFVDIFPLGQSSLDNVIQFSRRSAQALRSGVATGPGVRYPQVLQDAYEDQLEEVTSVMNVSIPGRIFAPSKADQARRSMLLRFINLKKLYIDVGGLSRGVWGYHYDSPYGSQVCVFVELSEFRNGKFWMKYDDFESFFQEYRDKCGGNSDASMLAPRATEAWQDVKAWEQQLLDSFLEVLDMFTNKHIECIIVYSCMMKESIFPFTEEQP